MNDVGRTLLGCVCCLSDSDVALPLAANVHDSSVVLVMIGGLLLLPETLVGALLGASDRIPTAVMYLLVIAADGRGRGSWAVMPA